ncbi:FAST kinase domain-containing protein 3, mitochondrial isoform X1 [Frieseomelitta varia]|uniref:FAST kinase domain-containing protein 3, mitochondrial isoform X1 n=1 Tax=Frieseomelitta varia TaxID=561572 RepID=UPI001CB680EC|nr:FAST kinase domain-containing protein 3, mitochondrial isoform X1 [Frieseomelitta varia]
MILAGHVWTKFLMRMQPVSITKFINRCYESNSGKYAGQQNLTQTSIFVEEGLEIQEVPLIVRKIKDIETICKNIDRNSISVINNCYNGPDTSKKTVPLDAKNNTNSKSNTNAKSKLLNRRIDIETDEGTAILFCSDLDCFKDLDIDETLQLFNVTNNVYPILENQISQEINCRVALEGLKKVIDLENSWFKQKSNKTQKTKQFDVDNTTRNMIMKQLIKLIINSNNAEMIVQGLIALKKDKVSPSRNIYRDLMCDEALSRATDGEFSPAQLVNLIKILSSYKDSKYCKSIDTLWVGILLQEQVINAHTLVALFKVLKYFNQSKNIVKLILERKLSDCWLKLSGTQIAEILDSFHDDVSAMKCLMSASKWASISMNASSEKDLINFIRSLHVKNYIDERIENTLQNYLKSKALQIDNSKLIATIMNYCKDLQIRNESILSECGKYFMKHAMNLSTSLLPSIFTPFGLLYVQPPNSAEFWKIFDDVLSVKFHDLKLDDALDILLSCTYLEKYPVKFFDKIFISQLLHKIHLRNHSVFSNRIKSKLKLLDATMFLESKEYQSLYFPLRKVEKPLFLDIRIKRAVNMIYQPLASLVGGEQKLSKNVILNRLPPINFYILDILIHPHMISTSVFHLNLDQEKNVNTAVFIYLPEYYCRNTHHLIGPQIMKKRQIKKLGFKVMTLDYVTIQEFWNQSNRLSSYLLKSLHSAENSL